MTPCCEDIFYIAKVTPFIDNHRAETNVSQQGDGLKFPMAFSTFVKCCSTPVKSGHNPNRLFPTSFELICRTKNNFNEIYTWGVKLRTQIVWHVSRIFLFCKKKSARMGFVWSGNSQKWSYHKVKKRWVLIHFPRKNGENAERCHTKNLFSYQLLPSPLPDIHCGVRLSQKMSDTWTLNHVKICHCRNAKFPLQWRAQQHSCYE